ncbi:hypothetical protein K432DRAFT_335574 [Lepidopterella palustris CBS 459.81]|uniref:Uncharacterized protein n=1 Tax=Lepidopterella palustris CBS 459.81 TaxID=1314670 RepID=A0A8E2E338_9PEZI|nr:hypothetical protein K432DRAFT_335574 [Lepidopterella palustris CBS 459.81]
MATPALCKARQLTDLTGQTPCDKPATSLNGRLCSYHSRRCQALYRGYKRRNAQLDDLSKSMPPYLANTKVALVNQTFKDVDSESTLQELHGYLFKKHTLLEAVIRGRKLHHSHFFAVDNDYGHEKFLAQLQKEKYTTARALEKLGRRLADVLYQQQKWFTWIRQCQDDEEARRETESKKNKLEGAMFRKYKKEVERNQREAKAREDRKRNEIFLDEIYNQTLSEMTEDGQDEWDPVQDVSQDERASYIELIKYFLMLKDSDTPEESADGASVSAISVGPKYSATDGEPAESSKNAKNKAKKSKTETPKHSKADTVDNDKSRAEFIEMETQAQIRRRLGEGVKYAHEAGMYVVGTIENPVELEGKSPPMPADEIDVLLKEIAEIKNLLFCRLLLSHAALLPVALRANSVEDFLDDKEVTLEDLRDLCLKMEKPGLQEVRDACADLVREEEENSSGGTEDHEEDEELNVLDLIDPFRPSKGPIQRVPKVFQTKREKALGKKRRQVKKLQEIAGLDNNGALVDFGVIDDDGKYKQKKMRIKICGRYIYNYPSEKAMNRGGWLHFCIIAKESDLYNAIELCRNWDEFFELNILATYQYFPAAKWMIWVGDRLRQQLLSFGFIPYFQSDKADELTVHHQTGGRGQYRRSHHIREWRNFICGHIKRNDPASRRLIQYLSMETAHIIVLVRDAKTGRTLISPPENELWLVREKVGLGRASKKDYNIISYVGPKFFEEMDKYRKWHFGFDEYYDIYVWDHAPGNPFPYLYNKLQQALIKANRICTLPDYYKIASPILKTLVRDPITFRCRSIKPGEEVESIWDIINNSKSSFRGFNERNEEVAMNNVLKTHVYNEADVFEDMILFPEESLGDMKNNLFKENPSTMVVFERAGPLVVNPRRFALDLDTDDELSDYEDETERPTDGHSLMPSHKGEDETEDEGVSEDEEMDTDEESENPMKLFNEKFIESMSLSKREGRMLDIANSTSQALSHARLPASFNDADYMAFMRLSLSRQTDFSDTSPENLDRDFMRYMDRQKSKVFKDCWHKGDLEPGATEKYKELQKIVLQMDDYQMTKLTMGPFEMLAFLGVMPRHRRVVPDAFHAYAGVALFFEAEGFLNSDNGQEFKQSLLLNQAERAKKLPNRRTHMSNKTLPEELWVPWDTLLRTNKRKHGQAVDDIYPFEWDKAIRPIIAHLYRAGVICNSYSDYIAGKALAIAEPSRPLDLFIDYRMELDGITMPPELQDPRTITRQTLLSRARAFAQKHGPAVRFAVLKIWSAPHFYPLMLGIDRRPTVTFLDSVARAWEWKFIPKDMPCSEWSIHHQARLRIKPYEDAFGDQVIVKRDLYLVMGKDEAELRKLAVGVTWAVQTEPWRLEIDFWKSFVNIELEFLEGLNTVWLD